MAQKQMLPLNIRVDRNCQPTWVTQNAIPEEQELILIGGMWGPESSPPYRHRVKAFYLTVSHGNRHSKIPILWNQINAHSMCRFILSVDFVPRWRWWCLVGTLIPALIINITLTEYHFMFQEMFMNNFHRKEYGKSKIQEFSKFKFFLD